MKNIILLSAFFLCLFTTGQAQQRREKLESLKVAFISERLNLDTKTAEKFWPVYHQYEDEMRGAIRQLRQSDTDPGADDLLEKEQRVLDIKKKYAPQFLKIISNDQLTSLYKAEREFRTMVLKKMKRGQQE
jgi:Skp family chaperone for outer membrane proteins